MKKKKITAPLLLKKDIIANLNMVTSGGNEPETMPVNSYRCETAGAPCTTDDPEPNPMSCDCGSPTFRDTYAQCGTRPGHAC
ncbi:MAG TPA: hypothetical protein VM802_30785 [Chitinophaga sp.]|uniref:hypothetical protein n=1 Tax=Chitinophaga sp. TaxID=1869181 RepID=UPI002B9DB748|nr:hypothetical protein [Chitinophaga sp.]HVI49292.1 hypothetical protein [Chitinophaga sp.]